MEPTNRRDDNDGTPIYDSVLNATLAGIVACWVEDATNAAARHETAVRILTSRAARAEDLATAMGGWATYFDTFGLST